MKLTMRALVDAAHTGSGMARTEGDEDEDETFLDAGQLQDEGEGLLGGRAANVWENVWEVELRAAGECGPIGTLWLTGAEPSKLDAATLKPVAGRSGDLERSA